MTSRKHSYAADALTLMARVADYVKLLRKENAALRHEVAQLRAKLAEQERAA